MGGTEEMQAWKSHLPDIPRCTSTLVCPARGEVRSVTLLLVEEASQGILSGLSCISQGGYPARFALHDPIPGHS